MSETRLSPLPVLSNAERVKAILKQRAIDLAHPALHDSAASNSLSVVEFCLATERYAIEHRHVREVQLLKDLTPLPCTPPFLRGVINLRGQILPVIDIKKFFDLPETGITDIHMVIVIEVDGVEVGLLADAVTGVRSVLLTDIQSTLPTLTDIRAKYLKGVTKGHVVILDALKILADPKVAVNEEVET